MKKTLVYLLMFFAVPAFGQAVGLHLPKEKPAYNWKRGALVFGLGAVSGTAYAFHEVSVHKPSMFPVSWNREWWHEQAAWRNKYKNGDPNQGPKYFGSTSFFVAPTSAKHTFGTVHRAGLLATGITIGFGEKRPLWHYAVDLAAGFLGYTTMFHLTYSEGVFFGRN